MPTFKNFSNVASNISPEMVILSTAPRVNIEARPFKMTGSVHHRSQHPQACDDPPQHRDSWKAGREMAWRVTRA